jgi:hypothetical protein
LLEPGFAQRLQVPTPTAGESQPNRPPYYVSWSNHLDPNATRIRLQQEAEARKGDAPTQRLQADWRQRLEDVLWSLLNAPEFLFSS